MSSKLPKESTLEGLIEDLDQRGLLVLQVLLGQQAMKLLAEQHTKKVVPSDLLLSKSTNLVLPVRQ